MKLKTVSALVIVSALLLCQGCVDSPSAPPTNSGDATTAAADDGGGSEEVVVRQDTFQIRYALDTTSQPSSGISLGGTTQYLLVPAVEDGSLVKAGQVIGDQTIKPSLRDSIEALASQDASTRLSLARLEAGQGPVISPLAGIARLGDGGGVLVETYGLDLVAELTPIQALRFASMHFNGTGTIETVSGLQTFVCEAVWSTHVSSEPTSNAEEDTDPVAAGSGSSSVHCRIPAYIETVPGLRGTLNAASDRIDQAKLVPNRFVGLDLTDGSRFVEVRADDGGTQRITVTAGPTDGVVRVVEASDLKVGSVLVEPLSDAAGADQ